MRSRQDRRALSNAGGEEAVCVPRRRPSPQLPATSPVKAGPRDGGEAEAETRDAEENAEHPLRRASAILPGPGSLSTRPRWGSAGRALAAPRPEAPAGARGVPRSVPRPAGRVAHCSPRPWPLSGATGLHPMPGDALTDTQSGVSPPLTHWLLFLSSHPQGTAVRTFGVR